MGGVRLGAAPLTLAVTIATFQHLSVIDLKRKDTEIDILSAIKGASPVSPQLML